MRKIVMLPLIAMLALSACNTVKGVGRDVSTGGKAITEGAATTQRKL